MDMICFTDYLFIPSPPVQTVQVLHGSVFVAKPLNCLTKLIIKLPEDYSWGHIPLSLSRFSFCCFLSQHRSMVATRLNRVLHIYPKIGQGWSGFSLGNAIFQLLGALKDFCFFMAPLAVDRLKSKS